MKKYPVIYKNQEYEVRWEEETWGSVVMWTYISIYKVHISKFFKIKLYKRVYRIDEDNLNEWMSIIKDDTDYYIEQVKGTFKLWEDDKKETEYKNKLALQKKKSLEEWDGVIKDVL